MAGFDGAVDDENVVVINATWLKHGLTRLGVWCALVGVTVLLTVLFSFLGNLTCAVLSGMILGAARQWRWHTLPVSLVFPAVILLLSHYSKLELPSGKVHLIALVCGAAFWGVYGMAFGLSFLEKKPEGPAGGASETAPCVPREFRLAALRGSWTCEDAATNGARQCKKLQIEDGKFALTVVERGGQVRVVAQGDVSVDAARTESPLITFNAMPNSPGRPREPAHDSPGGSKFCFDTPPVCGCDVGRRDYPARPILDSQPLNANMTSTLKILTCSLAATVTLLAASTALSAPIPEDSKIGGFAIGCQAYTFNRFSVMEAIEKTALTGSKVIEFYPGQKLSVDQPNVKWDHKASDEVMAQVKAQLAKHGVRAVNYGVVGAADAAEWRQIFEFAKKLGLYAVTTERVNQLDMIEPLVKEFDISVAIHNHPRQANNPDYKVWDPAYVLSVVKDRDARIGACVDVGHWATSGIVPLDGIKLLQGRIVSGHLKDRTAIGKSTEDVPFGSGISNFKGILDELKRQGFAGNLSIEYETKWDNSVPDVAQCVGFFRGYGACQ